MARNRAQGVPYQTERVSKSFTTRFGVDEYLVEAVPMTVTLDPDAVNNDQVVIQDVTLEAAIHNVTILASEGQTINGFGASMLLDIDGGSAQLTFRDNVWIPSVWVATGVGSGPLTPLPSWQLSYWIDPQNASGTASDGNSGTSPTRALRTFRQLATIWGTLQIVTNTTNTAIVITFLSSHTDNTDPVVLETLFVAGSYCIVQGVLGAAQTIATGVLSSVTAKNRATPQLLQANIGGSGAAGLLLHNTTRDAYAWVYIHVSGDVWKLSQPFAAATLPIPGNTPLAEVDTFTDGDAFTLYAPVQVNIVNASPTLVDYDTSTYGNLLYIYHLTIFDPSGASSDCFYRDDHVNLVECAAQRTVVNVFQVSDVWTLAANVYCSGGWLGGPTQGEGFDAIIGGVQAGYVLSVATGTVLDGDVIVAPSPLGALLYNGGTVALCYIETGITLYLSGGSPKLIDVCYSSAGVDGQALWGPGGVALYYSAQWYYKPDYGAAAIMLFKGGIQFGADPTSTTAYSIAGTTLHAGISLTPANLDAAAGAAGFGGRAFLLGGPSIVAGEA